MPHSTQFHYVYILKSVNHPEKSYVGQTTNLRTRLQSHNNGEGKHTRKHRPWTIQTAIAFNDSEKALAFENYLKTGSGRAFSKRHL